MNQSILSIVFITWLLSWAPLTQANTSGVELVSGQLDLVSFQWRLRPTEAGNVSASIADYGVINVSPGLYQLEIGFDKSTWLTLKQLEVTENQIKKISLDTGVTLIPIEGITPNNWTINDSNNKLYAYIKKQWGAVGLLPGNYYIEVGLPNQSNTIKHSFTVEQGQQLAVNVGTGISLISDIVKQAPQRWSLKSIDGQRQGSTIRNRWGVALAYPGEYQLQVQLKGQTPIDYKKITIEKNQIKPINIDTGILLQNTKDLENFSLYNAENKYNFGSSEPSFLPAPPGQYQLKIKLKNQSRINYQIVDIKQGEILTVPINTGIQLLQSADIIGQVKASVHLKNNRQSVARASSINKFIATPPGDYYISLSAKNQTPIRYLDAVVESQKVLKIPIDTAINLSANSIFGMPNQWELQELGSTKQYTSIRKQWGLALSPPGQYILNITLPSQRKINYGIVDIVKGVMNNIAIESGLSLTVNKPDDKTTLVVYRLGESKPVYRSKLISTVLPLSPGQYRIVSKSKAHYTWSPLIDIKPGDIHQLTDSFIEPESVDTAVTLAHDFQTSGFNIAKKILGGSVVSVSSQFQEEEWQGDNLIDGFDYINNLSMSGRCKKTCGWLSKPDDINPSELTLSFYQQRLATIDSVIIDNAFPKRANNIKTMPKRVSIWVSSESPTDGFTQVAEAKLEPIHKPQSITLPASTQAKYVKVKVISTYGNNQASLGEVSVIESDVQQSIIYDVEKDLARPENGGALVWFTSQHPGKGAPQLIWQGDSFWPSPWHSFKSKAGPDNYLPQDIVFGFNDNRIAMIDHIIIDPSGLDLSGTNKGKASLAKEIVIEQSLASPITGFEEIARVELLAEATPQKFTINQQARFIRLRVTETQGEGHFIKLGKVSIIESNQPSYRSVLLKQNISSSSTAFTEKPEISPTALNTASELEPNNTQADATPLSYDQWIKGVISPLGENDYYRLTVPTQAVITSELYSEPFIQTYLSVYDSNGNSRYEFSPKDLLSNRKTFSLQMPAGNYWYHLTQATTSIVLIWDTSGSMKGNEKDLSTAVMSFIEKIRPSEKLQLIKFSSKTNILTKEFTSNIDVLKKAAENNFNADGSTRLYDAIETGLDLLADEKGNKAIVVMTDGQDSASTRAYFDFWHQVKQKNVRIYTVGLGDTLQKYSYKIGATGKQFLEYLSLATHSKSLYAETSDQLTAIYQSIVSELTDQGEYRLKVHNNDSFGFLRLTTRDKLLPNTTIKNFALILDASGSMRSQNNRIEGDLKIDVAKKVLTNIIDKLPDTSHLAFRVFGHRIKEYDEGDCKDTELLYPLAQLNRDQLVNTINKIKVTNGTTPLTYSIIQAAKDLISVDGEKHIVLVTDGEEYCGADPEGVVKKMVELGIDVHIDIVGMDLKRKSVREDMQRIAHTTGGQFYNVTTNEDFETAIASVLGVKYSVVDSAGNEITDGKINGEIIKLAQGVYTIKVKSQADPVIVGEVFVKSDEVTTVDIVKNGQRVEKAAPTRKKARKHHWLSEERIAPKITVQENSLSSKMLQESLILLETQVLKSKANRPSR